jgi:hypothetical protein
MPVHLEKRAGDDRLLTPGEHFSFRSAVGAALFASVMTRPDISFACGALSRHLAHPTARSLRYLEHLFGYLKSNSDYAIVYSQEQWGLGVNPDVDDSEFFALVDSSYADPDIDFRSTTGYMVIWKSAPIVWSSKKQSITALSSAEAEVMGGSDCGKKIRALRQFFEELGLCPVRPTVLYEDNQSAIQYSVGELTHSRLRHVDIRRFALRDAVAAGILRMVYIRSEHNVPDMLTKALAGFVLAKFRGLVLRSL